MYEQSSSIEYIALIKSYYYSLPKENTMVGTLEEDGNE